VRDYGNRVGIWRLMKVLTRYGIRASAALNSEVCDNHLEIIEEGNRLGWEWLGHNQTNALRPGRRRGRRPRLERGAQRHAQRAQHVGRRAAPAARQPRGVLGPPVEEHEGPRDRAVSPPLLAERLAEIGVGR
jgi:hypothetical protein